MGVVILQSLQTEGARFGYDISRESPSSYCNPACLCLFLGDRAQASLSELEDGPTPLPPEVVVLYNDGARRRT